MAATYEGFSIDLDETLELTILTIRGELDLATAPEVVAGCSRLAARGRVTVICDATQVSFIDAAGVEGLITCRSAIHESGGTCAIVPSRQVRRLLDLLDPGVFVVYPTLAQGIADTGA